MFSNVAQDFRKGRTSLRPLQNLSNTLFMLPPFSMEMTRVWSSSLIQIKNVFSLLCLNEDVLDYVLIMTFQGQIHWKGQTPTTSHHTPNTHACSIWGCQSCTIPDSPGIWPVTSHSCTSQQWGHRFVKEEVVLHQTDQRERTEMDRQDQQNTEQRKEVIR